MKWTSPTVTKSKIMCKFCGEVQPDMPELRTHVRGQHPAQWRSFARAVELFDQEHAAELSGVCPICPHLGKHAH